MSADEIVIKNDDKVVPLTLGVGTGPKLVKQTFEPNERVITHCKKLLEKAEKGEIRAIAYALVEHSDLSAVGSINWGWTNEPVTMFALDASISTLRRRWDVELTADDNK